MGGPLTRPSGDRTQELTRVRLVTVSFISNAQCVTTTTFGGKERKSPESICRAPRTLFRRVFFFLLLLLFRFQHAKLGGFYRREFSRAWAGRVAGINHTKSLFFFPASSNEDRQVRRPIKSNKAFRLVLKGETRHLLEKPKRGRQTIKDLLKLLLLLISSIMFSPVFLANYRDKANRGNLILAHRIW